MMERDNSLLESILREVAAHPEVRSIKLVNHDGEVRVSSDSTQIGVATTPGFADVSGLP